MKGRKIREAKKKRMKARVKGGIFVRAYLKIGDAAPQIVFAIMRAIIGFISLVYRVFLLFIQVNDEFTDKPCHHDLDPNNDGKDP